MADLIKKVKIMQQDSTFTDYIPLGADAINVKTEDGMSVENKIKKKPYYYDTVADMKDDTKLKAGDMAVTLGYYTVNDGGGAEYKIVNASSQTEYQEGLNNSLYATLIINDFINIKQLGANETVVNDTNALKTFANLNIKKMIIPSGSYKLNDIIDLQNKELVGIDNPIINIIGITTSREHTIHVSGSCHIDGINFEQSIAMTNIMGLFYAHDTIIENCSFKVNDVRCNGYFDLYTDNHNIRVLNCNFDCTSTETVDEEKVNAIGGIWVRQYHSTYTSDNIIFENCIINHQSKDEALGVWNDKTPCLLSNVQINNCIIKDKEGATNPHLITFSANNSSINNCLIERIQNDTTQRSSIIHQTQTYGVPVTINNCVINTNTKHANGIFNTAKGIINNCLINDTSEMTILLMTGTVIKNSKINCVSFQNQYTTVTLDNCELNISDQSSSHSWLFRHTCTLINNVFNFTNANPGAFIFLVGATTTGENIFLSGNIFNFYNNSAIALANMNNTTGNHIVAIGNINVGNITSQGECTGVFANNIMTTALITYTNIKTNNNFNIG